MSHAIDLTTYGKELKEAYNVVASSDPDTSWAVFGYKGATNSLREDDAGSGGLDEFCAAFNENRVQYGVIRVDCDTAPKIVLVGYAADGTPHSQKISFNAHFASVAKLFNHHIQVTARDPEDVTPRHILSKLESGRKPVPLSSSRPTPPTKPKYRVASEGANEGDWGDDAPPVNEVEHIKLSSSTSYKPTRVNISEIQAAKKERQYGGADATIEGLDSSSSYKPVGKVDIKAIREAAKSSKFADTRLEKIESSYKPVGKVDIKAIRETARKQKEFASRRVSHSDITSGDEESDDDNKQKRRPQPQPAKRSVGPPRMRNVKDEVVEDDESGFQSVADRMRALNSDLKAARPANEVKPSAPSRRVTSGSRVKSGQVFGSGGIQVEAPKIDHAKKGFTDYASENGKTPAQLWAEKHGKVTPRSSARPSSNRPDDDDEQRSLQSQNSDVDESVDLVKPSSTKNRRTFVPVDAEEVEGKDTSTTKRHPLQNGVRSKFEQRGDDEEEAEPKNSFAEITSRFAKKTADAAPAEPAGDSRPSLPNRAARESEPVPEPEPVEEPDHGRDSESRDADAEDGGLTAVVEVEYEADPAEGNEISLVVGETITNIERLNEDWWLGKNSSGETGLFPAEYVKLEESFAATSSAPAAAAVSEAADDTATAIAEFDWDAEEDDELSFKVGDTITDIEFTSEHWWTGSAHGKTGQFPANYVKLQS